MLLARVWCTVVCPATGARVSAVAVLPWRHLEVGLTFAERNYVLARIRLGHTYLTDSYLLKREDQPECVGCACPLTVQHIMIGC